eukprot:tig00000571_g2184.t1
MTTRGRFLSVCYGGSGLASFFGPPKGGSKKRSEYARSLAQAAKWVREEAHVFAFEHLLNESRVRGPTWRREIKRRSGVRPLQLLEMAQERLGPEASREMTPEEKEMVLVYDKITSDYMAKGHTFVDKWELTASHDSHVRRCAIRELLQRGVLVECEGASGVARSEIFAAEQRIADALFRHEGQSSFASTLSRTCKRMESPWGDIVALCIDEVGLADIKTLARVLEAVVEKEMPNGKRFFHGLQHIILMGDVNQTVNQANQAACEVLQARQWKRGVFAPGDKVVLRKNDPGVKVFSLAKKYATAEAARDAGRTREVPGGTGESQREAGEVDVHVFNGRQAVVMAVFDGKLSRTDGVDVVEAAQRDADARAPAVWEPCEGDVGMENCVLESTADARRRGLARMLELRFEGGKRAIFKLSTLRRHGLQHAWARTIMTAQGGQAKLVMFVMEPWQNQHGSDVFLNRRARLASKIEYEI